MSGVPKCIACGELLGLYYADCWVCWEHREDYTLSDYRHAETSR